MLHLNGPKDRSSLQRSTRDSLICNLQPILTSYVIRFDELCHPFFSRELKMWSMCEFHRLEGYLDEAMAVHLPISNQS